MNRPVNREQIAAALQGLPFTLSEHDEGGGVTATYTGEASRAGEQRARAAWRLARIDMPAFAINWYTLHIASPDVAGQPMLSGGVSQ